ncbi:sushi, von Willebrand factor type A, EGF and pentraxin domain-containing protein 1-like isoform X1 [Mercenaria mercenaria]|uniref:sushi, von Willebrand factor type A, EGF and pentraxin domain-containing protein 1-like isoform X1 n=1 Tax=Mercenaria mercenaria TaxID=6596 RepID=UPI00234F25F4|nr:sushi, von Willebrand factor type A, EGF and pentraxin domain-containing protein 1-like isoform X1 [Mercenaria mercenaria]
MFPSLTVTCPSLTAPDSGTVSYSTNGATTTASYTCSSEYSLAGPESRVCQSNNSWADEDPTCTCIVPTVPANGSFTVAVDGTLTYFCDVGFVLNGDRTRTCQTNSNTWSGVEPACDPCDDIVATAGLNITASATGTTTISLFSCAAGYTLDGTSNSTCLLSGSWDSNAPTCSLCEDINSTNTLQVAVTTDGYVSTATFTCVTGYHVVGPSSATCDEAGAWSSIPTCECDEQTASSNGDIEGNGTSSQFSCNAGYSLIGSSVTECLNDGTGWSADPPSCDECDSLVSPVGGYYNLSTDGVVTMATYFCNPGYTMSGQQYSYCQNDGTWNETAPTCIKCPDLTDPASGTVTINTDGVTSVAQYACASEYDISGETASTCLTDGTWDNAPPTCSCSPASVPADGSVLSDNGESVYYQCNLNYSMNGRSVRECSADGTGWSGSDPICVPCENLVSVPGGSFSPTTDGVNTKVEYSCDVGYTINGKKEITCNSDGTWDSSQSTCTQCDTLTAPSGGNFTTYSDDSTVTKAIFTCDVGYTLDGYSELTCEETGQWDNEIPQCVECKARGDPTSGNLTLTTDGQTTTGIYSCADGYTIVGQQTISCRIDGNWNYPSSECECETPSAPVNGNVSADGETVIFYCDTGFTMSGGSTGNCNNDGTGWSIPTPQCVQCESLDSFTSGNVTYVSDGSATVVEYSCPEGFTLQGTPLVSCNASGNWETEIPECVSCPTLPSVSVVTGSVSLATNGTATTAEYSCPQGYEVKGLQTLTCNSDGTWSDDPSDCVCETPTIPEGGNYTISEDGLSVSFSCGEGYTMEGEQTISCGTDGSGWALVYPNCTKCEELVTPSNGNITLVTSGTETTALYSCGVGYTLEGSAGPTCQSDGTWTTTEQTCVSCPDLPSIAVTNGSVSLESNGTTTVAVYSCPNGYEVSGPETLTCNSSGVWDSTPSTCVCKTPDIPTGGNYALSEDGLSVTFTCGEGYTMNGVQEISCITDGSGWTLTFPNCTQCDSLTPPAGGNVSLVTNGTQTVAVYSCDVGSSLDGEPTPECQEDGTWKSTEQTCVTCPSLPDVSITTGTVTLESDGTTTTAIYNCPEGYEVSGLQNISCNTDGTWSSSPSDCVCVTPTFTEGGNFTLSDDRLTVTFTCEAGYTMVGEQTITCGTDGSGWDIVQPNCTKCEDLTTPSGGEVALITSGTQTTAAYTCSVGYTLDGQPTPECGTDGTWSAEGPVCVSCPEAANITSGILNVTTDGQTTTAVYTCDSGYEMDGNAVLSCLTNGTFDNEPPICFCEAPPSPLFGNVLSNKTTAVYSCDQGYILKGTSTRTCQEDGRGWTDTAPSCITCATLVSPADGSYSLTTNGTVTIATFGCDVEYSMNGTQILVCLDDGSWSEQAPNCVKCPTLTQPNSGSLVMSSDNVTTSAKYTCSSSYYIVGEDNLLCSSEGEWSASEPFCACNNVTAPDNGNVEISVENGTAIYTCGLGYSIDGVVTRTCANDGSGWSHTQPSCVGCPNVTFTADGNSEIVSDGTVTSVNFQCEKGATIDGPVSLTCQSDGTWTSVQPTCVSCPGLDSPSSGNITVDTDGQISTVTYTCAESYKVVGEATQQCQTDGTWSGSNTTCVCVAPTPPANGTITLENNNHVAVYTCDIYFSLMGDSERTCQSDGSGWTGSSPTCVQCAPLISPSNGSLFTDTNSTHTISTFVCSLGTSMQGEATSVCLNDATWSSAEPVCVTCPSLSDPTSGNVTLFTDGLTTTAEYACASGYEVSGQSISTCLADGSWSYTTPECLCEDPSSFANGTVSSDGRDANFQCNVGYSLLGTSEITCNNNGTGWSEQFPECIKCNDVNAPSGGNVVFTSTGIATVAGFLCDVGATLNGSTSLTCQVDGSWNGTTPSCVSCEVLASPANGEYVMSTDGTTTTIQLQCNDGYEAAGTTNIECGTDGQWIYSKQSTCDKKEEVANSLLGALIGVSIASLLIITVLSILLARFVYLYLQRKSGGDKYTTNVTLFDSAGKFKYSDDEFPFNPVKLTRSAAPVNHERPVFDISGPFSTSPAPQGFENHVTGHEAVPESPLPIETHRSGNSIISFRRSTTTLTDKSLSSVTAITIESAKETPAITAPLAKNINGLPPIKNGTTPLQEPELKPRRLSPIPKHMQRRGKLSPSSPQINKVIKESKSDAEGRQSPFEGRSPIVMSHPLNVTDFESQSLDSVSMVGE